MLKGLAWLNELRASGVHMAYDVVQPLIEGSACAEAVTYMQGGTRHRVAASLVLLHNGVIPATQLAFGAGCTAGWDAAQRCWRPESDDWGATNVTRIAIAGDGAGILGAKAAACLGRLAALDAAVRLGKIDAARRDRLAHEDRAELSRQQSLRNVLDRLFPPALSLLAPGNADDIVCRCEEITVGEVEEAVALGSDGDQPGESVHALWHGSVPGPHVRTGRCRSDGANAEATGGTGRPTAHALAGAAGATGRTGATAMSARAIVVGGGLHGTSTGMHLAQKGLDVLVIEKNSVGRHASGVNAGGVRQLQRDVAEIPLSVAAMDRWLHLDAFLGADLAEMCEFTGNVGQLAVAENDAEMAQLEAREAELRALGWTHEELIDRAELRRVSPALAQHCVGGLISRRDGHATPYRTSQAFRIKAQRDGVRFQEGTRVLGLAQVGDSWRVETTAGNFDSDVVVNCGGAWGWQVAEMIGELLPRGHFAASMMVSARVPKFLDPVVLGTGRKLSFKQADNGTVIIGGGILGIPDLEAETAEPVAERLVESARTVHDLFPIMRTATIVRCWAGLEALMPDQIPVIGPSKVARNLWHAFGYSGHGFQLSSHCRLAAGRPDRGWEKPAATGAVSCRQVQRMSRVAILGAGGIGCGAAALLLERGHEAILWSPSGRVPRRSPMVRHCKRRDG